MEDRTIDDTQITASSYFSDSNNDYKPYLARLNNQGLNYWAPDVSAGYPLGSWIQVDFLTDVELYGIKIQGFHDSVNNQYNYVSQLEVQTGDSEEPLKFIEEEGGNPKVKVLIIPLILMDSRSYAVTYTNGISCTQFFDLFSFFSLYDHFP